VPLPEKNKHTIARDTILSQLGDFMKQIFDEIMQYWLIEE
jgi:hypothetical protein